MKIILKSEPIIQTPTHILESKVNLNNMLSGAEELSDSLLDEKLKEIEDESDII